MATKNVHHSSKRSDWATPWTFFRRLDAEFHFTLDVCALPWNTKCARYYAPGDLSIQTTARVVVPLGHDGLVRPWTDEVCWCNPPYGKKKKDNPRPWLERAVSAARFENATTVVLLAARTDTKWFHEVVWPNASELRFVKGRLTFLLPHGEQESAPFPSLVVIFRPGEAPGRQASLIEAS